MLVGLGNPGKRYQGNRHNVGFMVLDALALGAPSSWSKRFSGQWITADVEGESIYLLKPETYMNLSGQAVRRAADYFKVEAEAIWVVHDDVDLPFPTVRVKIGGGHGGHNGLRDIIQHLGTNNFVRIRVGVGRPGEANDTATHVLSDFSRNEQSTLDDVVTRCLDIIRYAVGRGARKAMNEFNGKALHEPEAETIQ